MNPLEPPRTCVFRGIELPWRFTILCGDMEIGMASVGCSIDGEFYIRSWEQNEKSDDCSVRIGRLVIEHTPGIDVTLCPPARCFHENRFGRDQVAP